MNKLIFVNRFYYPNHSATSQLLGDLAESLAGAGEEVYVVTSRLRSVDGKTELGSTETLRGVNIRRVATSRLGQHSTIGRATDYLTFLISSLYLLMRLVQKGDTVVAKTDPPMLSVICWLAATCRGAKLVNWLQDLFPELASEMGISLTKGYLGIALRWVRDLSLRGADLNVVVGQQMRAILLERGVSAESIAVIPNWADHKAIVPIPHERNQLRKEWGFENKFVVGYSGNMGRAHDFETLLQAAKALRNCSSIAFVIIGGGSQRKTFEKEVIRSGFKNIYFKDYQPRELLHLSLSVADVHVVSLLPNLEGLLVPSKIYGIAAAGRAICFIGNPEGEVAKLIHANACGITVALGESQRLAATFLEWARTPLVVEKMGRKSRKLLVERYSMSRAIRQWRFELTAIGAVRQTPPRSSTNSIAGKTRTIC